MDQPIFIVVSDLNQLPPDLQVRLRPNGSNTNLKYIAPTNPSPTPISNLVPATNSNKPIIIQTGSPAFRMVISNKPYNYQVGPLEYFAGKWSQLW